MAESELHVTSELSRDLNLFHITMMGMGMMIGAGVFLGVGNAIYYVGPGGVLLTFALNGLLAIFTAMSYAELSSAIPRAGGAYNFARVGFGRGTSFLAGWMEWFASSVAGSMYALTFSLYTLRFLAQIGVPFIGGHMDISIKICTIAVAGFFLFINYRGASETGRIGAIFTLGQTLFLVVIGIVGIVVAIKDPSRLQNFKPFLPHGWSRLFITMGFTYVAFEGYEVIAQAGDEAINPRQNLPKAMLYSVFFVTITYVIVAFATVVAVKAGSPGVVDAPWQWIGNFREQGFGEAISRLMPAANVLLTLAVIFASTSALNATIYSATRASFALGRDRMLPGMFSWISRARKTPYVALMATGLIVAIVALFLPVKDVTSSASMMFLFLFFLVNLCVIRIRLNMGDELVYGYLMPLFPLFPVLAILCQVILAEELRYMSIIAWMIAPAWILSGLAVYWFYSKSRVLTSSDEIIVLEEEKPVASDAYRVMVSVANPRNALQLVRNTYKVCGAKQAQLELLHMVPVPDQVALSDAERYMSEGREGIMEAMLYLDNFFSISTTFRYCRNIARGIVSAVREKNVDMLILGWHGKPRHSLFTLGSTLDPIIERSPCNVVIFKDCGDKDFKRVLVPIAGGRNSAFALEIAAIIATSSDSEIVALAIDSGRGPFDAQTFVNNQTDISEKLRNRIKIKTITATQVAKAIVTEAADYDVIILGTSREPLIYQISHNTVPEQVATLCDKPLVVVKASGGIRSWFKRWF